MSLVKIKPFLDGECIVLTINGDSVRSGDGKEYSLAVGENKFEIKSIMPDGLERVYKVNILRREKRSEATLKKLEIGGTLFNQLDTSKEEGYILEVDNLVESILITCESKNDKASIIIDSGETTIGSGSINKALKVGGNEINIKVIAEDGSNSKEYKVNVIRKAAGVQRLKKIETSVGALQPKFNPDSLNYRLLLQEVDTTIELSVDCEDVKSKVKINGEETKQKVMKFKGEKDSVLISVISWDSSSKSQYKIYLERIKSNDAGLSSLTFSRGILSPEFYTDVTKYTLSLKSTDTNVVVKAEPRHNKAKITINGETVKEKLLTILKDKDSVLIKV
ncbi:MAG: cadherin-like beta sandwich domain-containing protein, partial [Chitinispirillaceae bacterium]|nr:cadherin-like beta sandwich domain-containing protein [Chitinispirillaceae bacterium]